MINDAKLYCPMCKATFKQAEVKYVEEYPPLFKDLPTLVRFVCPHCQELVTMTKGDPHAIC